MLIILTNQTSNTSDKIIEPLIQRIESSGQIMQGDVLLTPIGLIDSDLVEMQPAGAKIAIMSATLQRSEGSHFIMGAKTLYSKPGSDRVDAFKSDGFVKIVHDQTNVDHMTVIVPPGNWEITRQREYSRDMENLAAKLKAARD